MLVSVVLESSGQDPTPMVPLGISLVETMAARPTVVIQYP